MKKSFSSRARIAVLVFFTLMILLLAGCSSLSAEDFYELPKLSDEYLQLQQKIDSVLSGGAEYSAPTSGTNRQAVQLEDIDGDGKKEAIAFFGVTGSDKPQKIYIFKNVDGVYEQTAILEGEGTGIDRITYVDMDEDGSKEIAVGWKMTKGVNMLSVYSMLNFQVKSIFETDYTEYIMSDMNGLGEDVVVLRISSSEPGGEAEIYSYSDGEIETKTAKLSQGIESLLRVRTTTLMGCREAVLIEGGISGSGMVTDILVFNNNELRNITLDKDSGVSTDTVRSYSVYCRDIDGNGILDVPRLVQLPGTEDSTYYTVEWYEYRSTGLCKLTATTYNNFTDGWYLVLPDDWKGNITVRRQDVLTGERRVVFSYIDGEETTDFLVIYTLSGDNRFERASSGGRFILSEKEETIYAASVVSSADLDITADPSIVKQNFRIIYSEWITGET